MSAHKNIDIRLRNIEKLNVMAAYSCIASCQLVIDKLGKFKEDLSKDILAPLIDSIAFIGQSVNDMNQFRRDQIKVRLPAKVRPGEKRPYRLATTFWR